MIIKLYVLKSKTKSMRYVGITNNLSDRLKRHQKNQSIVKRMIGDFDLIHSEDHPDYKTARKREKYLKSGAGREWMDKNL